MALTQNLNSLLLIDGLTTSVSNKDVVYKQLTLRETTVADERKAAEISERAVNINGTWQLLPSEEIYSQAMAMLSCEKFSCEGFDPIDQTVLDIHLFGKLSKYDLQAIQNRVMLLESAAQLRHGLITAETFAELQKEVMSEEEKSAPSLEGQNQGVGDNDTDSVPKVERITSGTGEVTKK